VGFSLVPEYKKGTHLLASTIGAPEKAHRKTLSMRPESGRVSADFPIFEISQVSIVTAAEATRNGLYYCVIRMVIGLVMNMKK
jgi:hypothetical protein